MEESYFRGHEATSANELYLYIYIFNERQRALAHALAHAHAHAHAARALTTLVTWQGSREAERGRPVTLTHSLTHSRDFTRFLRVNAS